MEKAAITKKKARNFVTDLPFHSFRTVEIGAKRGMYSTRWWSLAMKQLGLAAASLGAEETGAAKTKCPQIIAAIGWRVNEEPAGARSVPGNAHILAGNERVSANRTNNGFSRG